MVEPTLDMNLQTKVKKKNRIYLSSGSSSRVRRAEKHKIYVAASGGHIFYNLLLQDRGEGAARTATGSIVFMISNKGNDTRIYILVFIIIHVLTIQSKLNRDCHTVPECPN